MEGTATTKTLTAFFDGRVLLPDALLDLEPNARYVITVAPQPAPATNGDAWSLLDQLTGTISAPPDWASEHDHYLYDTPKQSTEPADE